MTIQARATLRSKKLGVLIRDARLAKHMTIAECAAHNGVTQEIFLTWEEGESSPSLPELERLSYAMKLPLHRFWNKLATSVEAPQTEKMDLPGFVDLRQHMIGVLLRQMRENGSVSLESLSELSGLSTDLLTAYELGERPIPLPELEGIIGLLGGQVELLFDQTSPVGLWMLQQKSIQDFLQLSPEIQNFVCKPVNRPYLEVAKKLSDMSTEKLRSLAEDLLEITL